MQKIILSGCSGKMGRAVAAAVALRSDCAVIAGVDLNTDMAADFPVFAAIDAYTGAADVLIDFSHPSALEGILSYCKKNKLPAVIATTGLSDAQVEKIKKAAVETPIFHSGNMSLGINLLIALAKKAASVLGGEFDIEIIEKHHNQKIDAPSGTALMIADAVRDCLDFTPRYMHDRHTRRQKRDSQEIGIHAVRGGTIVGEHEVLYCGHDEIISISHSAASKEVFATGAVNAALFMIGKEQGLYNMSDLVSFA